MKRRLGDYEPGQSLFRHDFREVSSAPSSRSIQSGSIAPPKLQALVYDIPPSTTAVFSYAIGSRKLSANEQFFVGAQTLIYVCYNNSNKTRRVIYSRQQSLHQQKANHNRFNRDGTLFFYPGWMRLMFSYVHALALDCFYSRISTRTFPRQHRMSQHCLLSRAWNLKRLKKAHTHTKKHRANRPIVRSFATEHESTGVWAESPRKRGLQSSILDISLSFRELPN